MPGNFIFSRHLFPNLPIDWLVHSTKVQKLGTCSPHFGYLSKQHAGQQEGVMSSHQDPCHGSVGWDLEVILQNALALPWNPETACASKTFRAIMSNGK